MPRPGRRGGDASREIFASGNVRPPNPFQPRGRAGAFGTGSNGVNTDGTTQPRQSERLLPLRPPNGRGAAQCVPRSLAGHEVGLARLSAKLIAFWELALGVWVCHGLCISFAYFMQTSRNPYALRFPSFSLSDMPRFGAIQSSSKLRRPLSERACRSTSSAVWDHSCGQTGILAARATPVILPTSPVSPLVGGALLDVADLVGETPALYGATLRTPPGEFVYFGAVASPNCAVTLIAAYQSVCSTRAPERPRRHF